MEWEAPAIVLDARPFGEGDAVATVFTEEHGAHRGLARGGFARSRAATWQKGTLVQVRWVGRLADQLARHPRRCRAPLADQLGERLAGHVLHDQQDDAAGPLGLVTDHEARGVAQEEDGQVMGVAQLEEPRRLVGTVTVDGPTEVARAVGHHPEGLPLHPDQGGDHPGPEPGP